MRSMFRALVGDFDLTVLLGPSRATTNAEFGPVLCLSYIVVTDFIVLSMLLAILDHASFRRVRTTFLGVGGGAGPRRRRRGVPRG